MTVEYKHEHLVRIVLANCEGSLRRGEFTRLKLLGIAILSVAFIVIRPDCFDRSELNLGYRGANVAGLDPT